MNNNFKKYRSMSYCDEQNIFFRGNIDQYEVGQIVVNMATNKEARIVDKTNSSLYVFEAANSDKGVDTYTYYNIKDFEKKFKTK